MEWLDVVDENGIPTGEIIERKEAHAKGIRHRTSHVWLMRKHDGQIEILLQKRSATKDSFPGCLDISSAGHIPAGISYEESAIRELREELGVEIDREALIFCGDLKKYQEAEFYGEPFLDNQVSRVFCIWMDVEPEKLSLQEEEVEEVCWMNLKDCKEGVARHSFNHCLIAEELEMLPEKQE